MRHGRSLANSGVKADDHVNILTREGVDATIAAADKLSGVDFVAAWCSDIPRAVQTAMTLLSAMDHKPIYVSHEPALRERAFGWDEFLTHDELDRLFTKEQQKEWDDHPDVCPTPYGETQREVADRAMRFVARRVCESLNAGNVLLVSHFYTCRAMRCLMNGDDLTRIGGYDMRNSEVISFTREDVIRSVDRWVSRRGPDRGRLEGLAELEHEQWKEWALSVFADLPQATRDKWGPLLVGYNELPDHEKEKDRVFARRVESFLEGRR